MDNLPGIDVNGLYAGAVGRLLRIGDARDRDPARWPDYPAEFGISGDDESALIRMACDNTLHQGPSDSEVVWAPVHAWRALAQMRSLAAIEPLLDWLLDQDLDDMALEQLPVVLGLIGPAVLPHLRAFLATRADCRWLMIVGQSAVRQLALYYPECRGECIELLVHALHNDSSFAPSSIGFAVCDLIDLKAVEAIDAIREAYARDAVDITIPGDLEDVEIALGLREHRDTPRPFHSLFGPRPAYVGDEFDCEPLPPRQEAGRNEPCPCGSGRKYKKCCL